MMSSIYGMERPGFWRNPKTMSERLEAPQSSKKKVHFYDESVQPNTPASKELIRGDILTKVEDYDARDLRHQDAELLFRTQDNRIRLVVRRDNKIAMNSGKANPISSIPTPNIQPSYIPYSEPYHYPQRSLSPLTRGPQNFAAVCANPIDALPHTNFSEIQNKQQQHQVEQHINFPPPVPPRTSCFSPQLARDSNQTPCEDENVAIQNQPYRTTPLILPGAKSNIHKSFTTDSYLRHHPNPNMRGSLNGDTTDALMKQKIADSVLNRVVGENHQAANNGPKVVHKQFNSPIQLYSEANIHQSAHNTLNQVPSVPYAAPQVQQYNPLANHKPQAPTYQSAAPQQQQQQQQQQFQSYPVAAPSVHSQVSAPTSSVPSPNNGLFTRPEPPQPHHQQNLPSKIQGYKKTVVYDPLKSETYRFLQEQETSYAGQQGPAQEVANPIQPRVFQPNRLVPGKKPVYNTQESFPPPDPRHVHVNTAGDEVIHQSNSFKRLMFHVLGETDY